MGLLQESRISRDGERKGAREGTVMEKGVRCVIRRYQPLMMNATIRQSKQTRIKFKNLKVSHKAF